MKPELEENARAGRPPDAPEAVELVGVAGLRVAGTRQLAGLSGQHAATRRTRQRVHETEAAPL